MPKKLALNSRIQTNQILTNDDEVSIPSLSSVLLAVPTEKLGVSDQIIRKVPILRIILSNSYNSCQVRVKFH